MLQLILLRQKPKVAAQRIVQKLLAPIKLKEKYESTITTLEKKEKDIVKEIEEAKRSIDKDEKLVRELVVVL
jgi:hypothetical protein